MSRSKLAACVVTVLLASAAPALAQAWAKGRARLVSPTPAAGAFGSAVAALDWDGDGDLEVAVGDPAKSGVPPAVRIYERTASGWQLVDTEDKELPIQFGARLAVGDFDENGTDDLLIGAPTASEGGGAVYWWRKVGDGDASSPVLSTAGASGGRCGTSLVVGDFDADGHLDFAAGCPLASFDAYTTVGRVEVVYGDGEGGFTGGNFFHQASSGVGGGPENGDAFGSSLAVGDFICDGVDDLAIGVPGEDVDGATDTGALHILPGTEDTGLTGAGSQLWHQGSTDMPGTSGDGDLFAAALAGGDFDRGVAGPYCDDLAIGIPDDAELEGGSVLVVSGDLDGLNLGSYVHLGWPAFTAPSNPTPQHRLGFALAAGRVDGDLVDDLVIGAQGLAEIGPIAPSAPGISVPGLACVLYGENQLYGQPVCFSSATGEFGASDPQFGAAIATGPSGKASGPGLILGSPSIREVFVLDTALFADGFELPGTGRWNAKKED